MFCHFSDCHLLVLWNWSLFPNVKIPKGRYNEANMIHKAIIYSKVRKK